MLRAVFSIDKSVRNDLSIGAQPQSGGSGPAPTNPPDQSNIIEWLKADSLSAGTLTTWPATIGLNAGTIGTSPTVVTNSQNGLPTVNFNGSVNQLATANFGSPQSQPFTIAVAFSDSSSGTNDVFICGLTSNYLIGANASKFIANAGSGNGNIAAFNTNFNILVVVFNGTSTTASLNGSALASISSSGTATFDGINLGTGQSGTLPSQVKLAEIIVWKVDETSNLSSIYSYLNNKWA